MDFETMLIISLLTVSPVLITVIILLIMPEWRYRVMGTPYYKIFIMEKGLVLKQILLVIKNQLVYLDFKNGVAWIIPDKDTLIQQRKSLIWFADKRSCCALKITDNDYQIVLDAINKEINADSIISKIPIINMFYLQRVNKIEKIFGNTRSDEHGENHYISGKIGYAAKVKLNPEFMIDAITFFHIATQLITDKIIKNPTSLWEMIERNLPIIIIGSIIIIGLLIFSNRQ